MEATETYPGLLYIDDNEVRTTSASDGIYVHYDHCAQSLSQAFVSFDSARISGNSVDAGMDGVHVYYDECGSSMSGYLAHFGALDVTTNNVTAASDGVYVHYYNTRVLNYDAAVSWGPVTINEKA